MKRMMLMASVLVAIAGVASAQAAKTWEVVNSPVKETLRAVHFGDKDHAWAAGDKGTVLSSVDGGATWAAVKTPSDGTLRGVHFVDVDHGTIVGDGDSDAPRPTRGHILFGRPMKCGTLLFTEDGGKEWERVWMFTNFDLRAIWMVSTTTGQICNHGGPGHPDGDAIVTTTGAHGWKSGRVFRALNDCCWPDAQHAWAVGSRVAVGFTPRPTHALYTNRAARIIHSEDGGSTWNPQDSPAGPGELRSVWFTDTSHGVTVGDGGTIQLTADGKTWKNVESGTKVNLYAVTFADAKRGWTCGQNSTVLETVDGGETWQPVKSPVQKDLFGLHTADGGNIVAVGASGTILRAK